MQSEDPGPVQMLGVCRKCNVPLPLRVAKENEKGALWLCATCGTQYCGVLDDDGRGDAHERVLLAPLRFDRSQLAPPPNVTADFIAERVHLDYRGPERRAHIRRPLAAPVAVVPLDACFFPTDRPFLGMACNISTGGIALVHTRSTTAPHLALELTIDEGREIRAVIRVVRCRAIGLFYEIAGPFLVRIAPAPRLS